MSDAEKDHRIKCIARAVVLEDRVPRTALPASPGNLLHVPVFGPTPDLLNKGLTEHGV